MRKPSWRYNESSNGKKGKGKTTLDQLAIENQKESHTTEASPEEFSKISLLRSNQNRPNETMKAK